VLYYVGGYGDTTGDIPANDLFCDEVTKDWDMIDKPDGKPVLRNAACIVRGSNIILFGGEIFEN
jgi:hypothetical protein